MGVYLRPLPSDLPAALSAGRGKGKGGGSSDHGKSGGGSGDGELPWEDPTRPQNVNDDESSQRRGSGDAASDGVTGDAGGPVAGAAGPEAAGSETGGFGDRSDGRFDFLRRECFNAANDNLCMNLDVPGSGPRPGSSSSVGIRSSSSSSSGGVRWCTGTGCSDSDHSSDLGGYMKAL